MIMYHYTIAIVYYYMPIMKMIIICTRIVIMIYSSIDNNIQRLLGAGYIHRLVLASTCIYIYIYIYMHTYSNV